MGKSKIQFIEVAPQSQNKTSEVETNTKMFPAQNSLTTSKVGLFNSNQAVIIRGLAESNSNVASERIQSDLKQFTETVSSIFKNSQEIRVLKPYRMESTYYKQEIKGGSPQGHFSQSFNLNSISIGKLQEAMQTTNLLLFVDLNAPNVMTTSCHDSTFDARVLSLCLDNFLE